MPCARRMLVVFSSPSLTSSPRPITSSAWLRNPPPFQMRDLWCERFLCSLPLPHSREIPLCDPSPKSSRLRPPLLFTSSCQPGPCLAPQSAFCIAAKVPLTQPPRPRSTANRSRSKQASFQLFAPQFDARLISASPFSMNLSEQRVFRSFFLTFFFRHDCGTHPSFQFPAVPVKLPNYVFFSHPRYPKSGI